MSQAPSSTPQVYGPAAPEGSAQDIPVQTPRKKFSLLPLWLSLPFIASLLVFGILLTGLWFWSLSGVHQTKAKNYAAARSGFSTQRTYTLHWPEPWVGLYNEGTVALMQDQPDPGVGLLEAALTKVPHELPNEIGKIDPASHECMVRYNLALGYELQGDAAKKASDEATAEQKYTQAEAMSDPCAPPPQSGDPNEDEEEGKGEGEGEDEDEQKDPNQESNERQEQKKQESQKAQGKEPDKSKSKPDDANGQKDPSPSSDEPDPESDEAEEQRQKDLEERNKKTTEQEQYQREKRKTGYGGTPW